ncbi:MAG: biopolymer transporter ExbD [Roseibacillus sp.]
MKIARRKMVATVPSFAMGDIGFLLLIFFVILARVQDDSHVQWDPAILSNLEGAGSPLANVAIDSAYKTYLNGEEIKNELLGPRLNAILGQTPAGQRNVFLKVHREAQAQHFEPVIQAIGEAGGDLVHILEPEPEPES